MLPFSLFIPTGSGRLPVCCCLHKALQPAVSFECTEDETEEGHIGKLFSCFVTLVSTLPLRALPSVPWNECPDSTYPLDVSQSLSR